MHAIAVIFVIVGICGSAGLGMYLEYRGWTHRPPIFWLIGLGGGTLSTIGLLQLLE